MSDLISRQAVINMKGLFEDWNGEVCEGVLVEDIERLPSAEPKKGKWIDVDPHGDAGLAFECSECEKINLRETNYCPNCGADMRGEE